MRVLYFKLKGWRDAVCNENDMPIYMLANSNSLQEICTYLPLTKNILSNSVVLEKQKLKSMAKRFWK
jgi:superfamily II DNA helicase RecQ